MNSNDGKKELFGWKTALADYTIVDLLKDSRLPLILSLTLVIVAGLLFDDILSVVKAVQAISLSILPVMLSLIVAAYTILMTMYWSPICDKIKSAKSSGLDLLKLLNSSFVICAYLMIIGLLFVVCVGVVLSLNISLVQNQAKIVNCIVLFFLLYFLLFAIWILKDISINIYNIGNFSIHI